MKRAPERIREVSDRPEDYCAHLRAIIDALIEKGNRVLLPFSDIGSEMSCYLVDPLDFDLLAERFEFPSTITLHPTFDRVSDSRNRIMIEGRRSWIRQIDDAARYYARERTAQPLPASLPDCSDTSPFEAVELVLGDLLNAGNSLEYYDWRWHDGKTARVRDPIDFERVRSTWIIPDFIELDEAHDTIRDTRYGYEIQGPGAMSDAAHRADDLPA